MDDTGGEMDVDQCLIGKFSSMGTTDKDVLIAEFRNLLGFQLNAAGCEFFLDMTNWNLHAAIGAYYDFEMPSGKIPSMAFMQDVTIGEGEAVPPDTEFLKTWRIRNSGLEKWPLGCTLRFVNGEKMNAPDWVAVTELEPGKYLDASVRMKSPASPGIYQGQWRIFTRNMLPFGDTIWVIISVEAGGLLGVTQQMSQFASNLGNSPGGAIFQSESSPNPFALSSSEPTATTTRNDDDPNQRQNLFSADSHEMTDGSAAFACEDLEMSEQSSKQFSTPTGRPNGSLHLHPANFKKTDVGSSLTCWTARSPTAIGDPGELDAGASHSLHSIPEDPGNQDLAASSGANFMTSKSPYDMNARQASPFNSPSKLRELERSFSSPDAPSPIKPTSKNLLLNFEGTSSAAQRLDFSSGS